VDRRIPVRSNRLLREVWHAEKQGVDVDGRGERDRLQCFPGRRRRKLELVMQRKVVAQREQGGDGRYEQQRDKCDFLELRLKGVQV
jgi:hypothetical protein